MKFVACFFLCVAIVQSAYASELRIVNIRVGQGDATLIQGPVNDDGTRVNVLFDAGDVKKRDAGNILRKVLDRYEVTQLDYLIISHDDQDHLGGIAFGKSTGRGGNHGASVILGYNNEPGCVGDDDSDGVNGWMEGKKNYVPDPDEIGKCDDLAVFHWVDYGEANMRNTHPIRKYNGMANSMGTRIALDDQTSVDSFVIELGNGATMRPYAALGFVKGGDGTPIPKVNKPNEKSLSFLLSYRTFDYLVSGDLIGKGTKDSINAKMEQAVGKAISDDGIVVDVLHVNHHGADNGSASDFLELIKPNIAIISAGNGNTHSHPRNSVLRRLKAAKTYRTILTSFGTSKEKISSEVRESLAVYQNDIVVTTNGDNYYISTTRGFHSDINCVDNPSKCSRGL